MCYIKNPLIILKRIFCAVRTVENFIFVSNIQVLGFTDI